MIGFHGGLFLLDIEGTLAPLAYVHEVLFPYARDRVGPFLQASGVDLAVAEALRQMARDASHEETGSWCPHPAGSVAAMEWIADEARRLMDLDAKQTGLKQLQGLIWEAGFVRHELKSVIYPDVPAALEHWVARGKEVRIYSSGSIHAQRLFFRHTTSGDLSRFLSGFYDTTTGPKRSPASYAKIAAEAGRAPEDVLFLSDVTAELDAAREAGCLTTLVVRPGNSPSPPHTHLLARSFDEIDLG